MKSNKSMLTDVVNNVVSGVVSGVVDGVVTSSVGTAVGNAVGTAGAAAGNAVGNVVGSAGAAAGNAVDSAMGRARGAVNSTVNAVSSTINALTPQMSMATVMERNVAPCFSDTAKISKYGDMQGMSETIAKTTSLMEQSPVSQLAGRIKQIISYLSDADPQAIQVKATWWGKLTGSALENRLRFEVARESLEETLADASKWSDKTEKAIELIDRLLSQNEAETAALKLHIEAGKTYLQENPESGKPVEGAMSFENPRDRFIRRLQNLSALLASHEMSVLQLRLVRGQALDLLDRFVETTTVLVPVWRQHSLAIASSTNLDPKMVAAATAAHNALQKSLASSLISLDKTLPTPVQAAKAL
jgi:plasmid stabilization system protein ParE